MKRSNRLVLLVGVFLAVVAFVGIILISQGGTGSGTPPVATTGPVVIAAVDIPLSSTVKATDVKIETKDLTAISAGAFTDVSQVIGKIARTSLKAGAQVTADAFLSSSTLVHPVVPAGLRAISVQVDQVTGVGTVIQNGDYVDLVAGLTGDKFPVVTVNPTDNAITVVAGVSGTSVKVLLQGIQVIGTLLPPATAAAAGSGTSGDGSTPAQPGTALNGQLEIVILAVTPQQAEVIKYAQIDSTISLVLRSPDDFQDPTTGEAITPIPVQTTGVILKTLVDTYGVLPPEVIETVTPKGK